MQCECGYPHTSKVQCGCGPHIKKRCGLDRYLIQIAMDLADDENLIFFRSDSNAHVLEEVVHTCSMLHAQNKV